MRFRETASCDGCGVEITWAPQPNSQRHYCCTTCFAGRPCACATRMESAADRRARVPTQPMADEAISCDSRQFGPPTRPTSVEPGSPTLAAPCPLRLQE
jgi:hypothetical protein